MPSPFPGMDPYLEAVDLWPDVHSTLIPLIRESLTPHLPEGYVAKIDQYVWLQDVDEERTRSGKPDVLLSNGRRSGGGASTVSVAASPGIAVTMPAKRKRRGSRFVSIEDSRRNKVVTVIELLSPSNKEGDDREVYLDRRMQYLSVGSNLVEIDLLRGGERIPMGKPYQPAADYLIFVCRGEDYPAARIWPFTVRDQIPIVPVPLKKVHDSIPLDLRSCLDHAYDGANYASQVDYSEPPTPSLRPSDAEWACALLKRDTTKRKK